MEKSILLQKIEELVSSLGFLLIEINLRGDNRQRIIEIYIDNEAGVSIEDCSRVSRKMNEVIEEEKLIESNYRLDVSSPGTDRSLKFLLQYPKHLNRKFEVEYLDGETPKKFVGKLIRIENEDLYFQENKNELKISFNSITKAKVIISF